MISDNNFLDANIIKFNKEDLYSLLYEYSVLIIPGFQALTTNDDITTLGHGGSDYTASVISTISKENKVYLHKDIFFVFQQVVFPVLRRFLPPVPDVPPAGNPIREPGIWGRRNGAA